MSDYNKRTWCDKSHKHAKYKLYGQHCIYCECGKRDCEVGKYVYYFCDFINNSCKSCENHLFWNNNPSINSIIEKDGKIICKFLNDCQNDLCDTCGSPTISYNVLENINNVNDTSLYEKYLMMRNEKLSICD